ncbi:RNA polymerase sigma factor [Krasilnikovia sp. MM14-A1004]|uniref:RNA polymerase sigma factor n=1 Tax=Krasilnikovia sp. MM14-A1004 TaxID=3373541 RepID=UPI00399D38B1
MGDRGIEVFGSRRKEFDDLFCELLPRLYRRAVVVSGDPEAAQDALHEAYLKLARHPQRLVEHPEPFAYAMVTVINVLRDEWRRRRRYLLRAEPQEIGDDGGLGWQDARRETVRMLAMLTPRQAAVVLLVDVDGYTIDQAAGVLGVHRGTVARLRRRALDKLRVHLDNGD